MKMRKLVAVLSAAAMTVTSLSITAFAVDTEPVAVGSSGTVSYTFDSNGKISTTTADNSKAIAIKDSSSEAVTSFTQNQVVLVTFAAATGKVPTISVNDVDGKQAADGTTDLITTDTSAKVVLTAATATEITLKGTNCTVTKVEVKEADASTAVGDSGTIEVVFDENGKIVTTATEQDVAIEDAESNAVTEFKKDDVVKVTFDAASASATVKVNNVAATLADDKTYATATLTANTAAKITLSGSNYTATKVEVTRANAGTTTPTEPTETSTDLAVTETILNDQGQAVEGHDPKNVEVAAAKFATAKAGDKIKLVLDATTYGAWHSANLKHKGTNWPNLEGTTAKVNGTDVEANEYNSFEVSGANAEFVYTLTATDVTNIKANGLVIGGYGVTLKSAALISTTTTTPGGDDDNPGDDNPGDDNPGDNGPANDPGYVVITPNDTTAATTTAAPDVVTAANGESVEAAKDVIPSGATLEAKEQTKEEAVKAVEAVKATDANKEVVETVKKAIEDAKAAVMDINLVKDGQKVQPNGTIKVTIKVPEALKSAANLFVYRVEDNGTFTDVKATVKDGKIEFTTSHFSTYIITSEALTGDAVVTEAAATTTPAATTADGNTTTDDKNQATGVVLAVIPAMLAAAGVVAAKKRK